MPIYIKLIWGIFVLWHNFRLCCSEYVYSMLSEQICGVVYIKKMLSYALFIFSVCMIGGMALNSNHLLDLSSTTLFGIWFLLLAVSQCLNALPIINNPIFRVLGKYSYPIYLFHFFLIGIYDRYIPGCTENMIINWAIKYIVVVVGALIIALILTKWIDGLLQKKIGEVLRKM